MVEHLRHPNCAGQASHPWKAEARLGPLTPDQCALCHMALNEPERVRALIEGRPVAVKAAEPATPAPAPEWPRWAKALAKFAAPGERGVGDTLARKLGRAGVLFKAAAARLGFDCGCGDRQERMNATYPY